MVFTRRAVLRQACPALLVAAAMATVPLEASAQAPAAPSAARDAQSFVEDGFVKLYFAPGSDLMPPDALPALRDVVKEVTVGQRAVIAVYAVTDDDTRDLATRRIVRLRAALRGLGLPLEKIEVRAPRPAPPTPDPGAARRVDLMVVD